ncbi:hypothetical protein B9Z19DRAFT_1068268 [Tuber borchii]|uniref:Uncharacterized protein n=1 Tax=Tuber borchii TaxID=42251 RepID=A0A2T6ZFZ9_TUBBO|nr:hypothetical protein B9Z19DRAFT_1068268 [Tuber borchii]
MTDHMITNTPEDITVELSSEVPTVFNVTSGKLTLKHREQAAEIELHRREISSRKIFLIDEITRINQRLDLVAEEVIGLLVQELVCLAEAIEQVRQRATRHERVNTQLWANIGQTEEESFSQDTMLDKALKETQMKFEAEIATARKELCMMDAQ